MFSVVMNTAPTMFIPPRTKTIFISANMKNMEQLRTQLLQLHTEAEKTRDKASNTRLRFMRLSEAAEKLQRQAITDIRIGRETEARELLFQKRKVIQALEKSKSRIEMLDELLAKLNEAISVKESQLIGNVSSGLEVSRQNLPTSVRIISPKEDDSDLVGVHAEHVEDQRLQFLEKNDAETLVSTQNEDTKVSGLSIGISDEAELVDGLSEIFSYDSYEEFVKHLDEQLDKIEVELITFLKYSALVLESVEKPKNLKVQHAQEILENVQRIRKRIASITKMKAGIN